MDLSLPGKKVEVVFAICRIRQFSDTTECLQDEIIVFVNKIVKIIHLCTQHWEGQPTKNYGDRYMITWKLPSFDDAVNSKEGTQLEGAPNVDPVNQSGNQNSVDEDIFGKKVGSGSGDQSVNMSSKIDERTSLLPDGTVGHGLKNRSADDGSSPSPNNAIFNEDEDQPFTKHQIFLRREEMVDKAFISAVKTLA